MCNVKPQLLKKSFVVKLRQCLHGRWQIVVKVLERHSVLFLIMNDFLTFEAEIASTDFKSTDSNQALYIIYLFIFCLGLSDLKNPF